MKKFFTILMTICLMVGVFSVASITASAEEAPASDVVIRVSAQKKDGKIVEIENGDFNSFVEGWEAAVDLANDHTKLDENNYDYVVVDLYADWKADKDGKFGNNDDLDGIENYTIYVPKDTRIVINMNGHTIDRGLGDNNEWDGEVIYVDENARLIINGGKSGDPAVKAGTQPGDIKMGKITGGNSDNGAGGIHVMDNAFVALTNVHVDGNTSDDDYGSGIALYNGASLVMSGGSLSNNSLVGTWGGYLSTGGTLYLKNSEAILSNVEIKNNQAYNDKGEGLAVYAEDSAVYLNDCIIDGNGIEIDADRRAPGISTIYIDDSTLVATKTCFTNNGAYVNLQKADAYSAVIKGDGTTNITFTECVFKNNLSNDIIDTSRTILMATKCEIVDNNSSVFEGYGTITFESCTFGNNKCEKTEDDTFEPAILFYNAVLTFRDCKMGDSTYEDPEDISFIDCESAPKGSKFLGSIFGEGSLTMIVSLVALIASVAAIVVNVSSKKKEVPVAAAEADEE